MGTATVKWIEGKQFIGIDSTNHQIRGMETPAFRRGEEMPPPAFSLVLMFNLSLHY